MCPKLRNAGSLIVKMDYTVESLFPVIPMALRAGMGRPQVERIRKLETVLVEFLKYRSKEAAFIEEARAFFLDCLARHDSEEWLLEPVEQELIDYVARVSGEDHNKVLADFDAIATFGQPGSDALPPVPFAARPARPLPKTADAPPQAAPDDQGEDPGAEGVENEPTVIDEAWPSVDRDLTGHVPDGKEAPEARVSAFGLKPLDRPELPQDVKSLRARMWTLATQLAQHNGLGECILPCSNKGCGYLVDLPLQPLYAGEIPQTLDEAKRVTLWWLLGALCEQWPYGPSLEMAPALSCLPDDARLYPAIEAVARADEIAAINAVLPFVSEPPSLDIASRQLFAILDDAEFDLIVNLIKTRRALQTQCRQRGKPIVWDL
jgi:hypothetical protein